MAGLSTRRGDGENRKAVNRRNLPKIPNKFRKLSHGGGDTGRTPHTNLISLGESSKKDNTHRERLARPQKPRTTDQGNF